MTHGSLFSGIGGFDLAADWMCWKNKFNCEIEQFCDRVLRHHFPEAERLTDITKTDFTKFYGKIDVLTGGFPCQPYSVAGKRRGKDDDRHLWPEMLRAIREIEPRWVVGENVRGLVSWNGGLVFNEVQADLEAAGYEVLPFILPACAVDAPHRRERIWFIAHRADAGAKGLREPKKQAGEFRTATDTESDRDRGGLRRVESSNEGQREPEKYRENRDKFRDNGQKWAAPDTDNAGADNCRGINGNGPAKNERRQRIARSEFRENGGNANDSNTDGATQTRYGSRSRNAEPPDWRNFPTQPPVCSGNDGVPSELVGITVSNHRNESIKGYGNAIVPQVAYEIFKTIELYEMYY